jgi:hypothetical protein
MDPRQRRMTQNEALSRRINERIERARPRNGGTADTFVCECVRADCNEALDMSHAAYVSVRSHPRRFAVVRAHVEPGIESIVEAHEGYVVVQKRGEAGRLAELDGVF